MNKFADFSDGDLIATYEEMTSMITKAAKLPEDFFDNYSLLTEVMESRDLLEENEVNG